MRKLENLTVLDLRGNEFTQLPAVILQMKNLQKLDISYTGITSLPAGIGQLKKLNYLAFSLDMLSEAEQQRIRKLLPDCELRAQ